MALAIAGCLILMVIGGLLPFLQGWIFFVLALYLFAAEFDTGRGFVKWARGRWPLLNRHLHEFEDMTDPGK
jgi:uncharacterized membrane protein YbaN (DUF454 family)